MFLSSHHVVVSRMFQEYINSELFTTPSLISWVICNIVLYISQIVDMFYLNRSITLFLYITTWFWLWSWLCLFISLMFTPGISKSMQLSCQILSHFGMSPSGNKPYFIGGSPWLSEASGQASIWNNTQSLCELHTICRLLRSSHQQPVPCS